MDMVLVLEGEVEEEEEEEEQEEEGEEEEEEGEEEDPAIQWDTRQRQPPFLSPTARCISIKHISYLT